MPESTIEIKKDVPVVKPWMYRKWQEFPSFFFLLSSIFVISAAVDVITDVFTFYLVGLFLVIFITYLENSRFKGSALLVTKSQYPRLYSIFENLV